MGGSGGYSRLPGGSDHFSWQTELHHNIYIIIFSNIANSPSLLSLSSLSSLLSLSSSAWNCVSPLLASPPSLCSQGSELLAMWENTKKSGSHAWGSWNIEKYSYRLPFYPEFKMRLTFWCLPKLGSDWVKFWKIFFGFLLFWSAWFPLRQTHRLEWDSWQSCMVYHLHVARLHSTNVAYSPLHTLSPATTIHSIQMLQYYHIPSA